MSDPPDDPFEKRLMRHLSDHDRVDPSTVADAKSWYALRLVDEIVAELGESETAARTNDDGDAESLITFRLGDTLILVDISPGSADIQVMPAPVEVWIETVSGAHPLDLDEFGATSAAGSGVVRLRVRHTDGTTVVTDGFLVPPAL